MQLVPEPIEGDALDDFWSDDGNHHVIWSNALEIPGWFCIIHNQLYYIDCLREPAQNPRNKNGMTT